MWRGNLKYQMKCTNIFQKWLVVVRSLGLSSSRRTRLWTPTPKSGFWPTRCSPPDQEEDGYGQVHPGHLAAGWSEANQAYTGMDWLDGIFGHTMLALKSRQGMFWAPSSLDMKPLWFLPLGAQERPCLQAHASNHG